VPLRHSAKVLQPFAIRIDRSELIGRVD